ncbi:MAG: complex I subunit 5 family protein [bacterium]
MNKITASVGVGVVLVFFLFCSLPSPAFSPPSLVSEVWASQPAEHSSHAAGEVTQRVAPETSIPSPLPLVVILIPLIGALMLLWLRDSQGQGIIVTLFSGLTLATSLLMYSPVIQGQRFAGALRQGIYYALPFLPSFSLNLTFRVDPAAFTLAVFTCLVWFLVAMFSQGYLAVEQHRLRYNFANLCCLSVTLGAFLAGDLFTLYIFYESILLFLYLMVIHREDEEALQSARVYLYFGVFTGLLLLFGIFLFSYFAGTVDMQSAAGALDRMAYPALKYGVAALFLIGFGGKAGVFLEHIWMPSSYGSAPCLTAALSSGVMIEVGAYGIFRTVNLIFAPSSHLENSAAWMTCAQLGYVLIFVGIMTMLLGAVNALLSTQALRLLAYSSVSQMGYIVMGIGCAAYMGRSGAMGLAGALYHIVNHALFKVGLFLSVGAVYFHTRELDIRKLGGLWRDLPIAALTLLISVLAIAGFPLLNGFASKTMLHHAILEAYQHSVHFSPTHTPDFGLRIAEIIFIITAGGTFAYTMKLFSMVFLGPKKEATSKPVSSPSPLGMNISLLLFSAGIVLFGLFPNWLLEHCIGPMLPYFGFDAHSHAYHLIYNIHAAALPHSTLPLWYDPVHRTLLASTEAIHNLSGGSTAILAGGTIFLIFLASGLSEKVLSPAWGLTPYYQKAFTGFRTVCRVTYQRVVGVAEKIISVLMVYLWIPGIKRELIVPDPVQHAEKGMFRLISHVDEHYARSVDQTVRAKGIFGHISQVDESYTQVIDRTARTRRMFGHFSRVDAMYDMVFDKARAVAERRLFDRISHADEKFSDSFDLAADKRSIFDNATRADGQLSGAYDRVIFSRFFWGMLTRRDEFKAGLWKYFNIVEVWYDRFIERALFDIIGSEDLSKIQLGGNDFAQSRFLRMCKRASEIHSGDISSYITWITITLTIIVATLVGFLYIKTFFAMIIALSTIVTFFGVLAAVITFFFKR